MTVEIPLNELINIRRQRLGRYLSPVEKKFHIGRIIKEKMKALRLKKVDIINSTGIPSNTFFNQLKKPSIDTAMLQRLSEAIGYNFFLDFISKRELKNLFDQNEFIDPSEHKKLQKEIDKLKAENEAQQKEFKELNIKYTRLLELILEKKEDVTDVKINGHI